MAFVDRRDAGHRLAETLTMLKRESPIVLALPRGGVPVAFEIADRLGAPLDILAVGGDSARYRGDRRPVDVRGRTVIVVSDGGKRRDKPAWSRR